uniref:Uncharacterized protein n=1 Tax=Hyaloperonospora arabidopsidis (strain Emoy2) TaxID=559515 RepID=M4B635_HYAAE
MGRSRALAERKCAAALYACAPLHDPPLIHATVPPPLGYTSDQEPLSGREKRKCQIQHVVKRT